MRKSFPVHDEQTPSRAHYFDWINSDWQGSTATKTLINLDFFRWLHEEYGMQLDYYALDAGNIDTQGEYGSTDSPKFKAKFPDGFRLDRRQGQCHGHPAGDVGRAGWLRQYSRGGTAADQHDGWPVPR
jgi:hypothetical protein